MNLHADSEDVGEFLFFIYIYLLRKNDLMFYFNVNRKYMLQILKTNVYSNKVLLQRLEIVSCQLTTFDKDIFNL